MNIFVSGSLAYDRIMDFPGKFSDHILPDKVHILNVSFTVKGLVERPGGTAGNIAYALALLGEKPTILATIGRDWQPYFRRLEKNGIPCHGIRIVEEELTASAYITTDRADNQITGFNPGAMKHPSRFSFAEVHPHGSIAIIAAGNLEDMAAYSDFYRAHGLPFIFDPGQSLPAWDAQALARSMESATLLISNDYELQLLMSRTGLDQARLLGRVGAIVTTKGERGSTLLTREGEVEIPAVRSTRGVVDPTGAGDAYRGGLIKGLVTGKDLLHSAQMGAVCASFAIECQGTQEYTFSAEAFNNRLQQFGVAA